MINRKTKLSLKRDRDRETELIQITGNSSIKPVIAACLNSVIGWTLGRRYNRGAAECGVCFPAPLCSLVEYKDGE